MNSKYEGYQRESRRVSRSDKLSYVTLAFLVVLVIAVSWMTERDNHPFNEPIVGTGSVN